MPSLQVSFGSDARDTLCAAFEHAQRSIRAEFFDLSDRQVIKSINAASRRHLDVELHIEERPHRFRHTRDAAERDAKAIAALRRALDPGVRLALENDPQVLMHCKAAVVDDSQALISTGNPTWSGFKDDGEVLVSTQDPDDIADVNASIAGQPVCGDRVIAGPNAALRLQLQRLFQSSSNLCIASEDLSDPRIVSDLCARNAAGHHDRVLISGKGMSRPQQDAAGRLQGLGVDLRATTGAYMHEKFVDDGNEIYVGSANLTHNGIDEGREIGVVAPASAFGDDALRLKKRFDEMWSSAKPLSV